MGAQADEMYFREDLFILVPKGICEKLFGMHITVFSC